MFKNWLCSNVLVFSFDGYILPWVVLFVNIFFEKSFVFL